MVYYARIMCIKIISFYCAVNMHLEKLWTIYRSSVLKNGSKIWFLAFLNYRCDRFFFSNRFLWSFYLAFTNGFDQKKTSSYIYSTNNLMQFQIDQSKYMHRKILNYKLCFSFSFICTVFYWKSKLRIYIWLSRLGTKLRF